MSDLLKIGENEYSKEDVLKMVEGSKLYWGRAVMNAVRVERALQELVKAAHDTAVIPNDDQ